jgi:hypothetical protein
MKPAFLLLQNIQRSYNLLTFNSTTATSHNPEQFTIEVLEILKAAPPTGNGLGDLWRQILLLRYRSFFRIRKALVLLNSVHQKVIVERQTADKFVVGVAPVKVELKSTVFFDG